jgi:peptidoglycan/xylan/chitin deacetylase (PgdA/CDA1 family)
MSMRKPTTVFLMYHEIELPRRGLCQSEPGYVRYVISIDEFKAQMSAIHELGLRGVSVGEALTFSTPAVAITVDDGCETDRLAIAPLLKQFGFGATFYITAGWIGKPGFLSLAQLRELHDLGFEIGCHSMTHPYLSDLDAVGLQQEIADAKTALEQMLGSSIEHYSFPGGRGHVHAVQVAKEAGYKTVATSLPQANTPASDLFALGRVAIKRGTQLKDFRRICQGRALWTIEFSSSLRDSAKRILGNAAYNRVRALLLRR